MKKRVTTAIAIILIVGIAVAAFILFSGTAQITIYKNNQLIPATTKTINLNGFSGTVTAAQFGTLTSGGGIRISGNEENGLVTIFNDYKEGQQVVLTSSVAGLDQSSTSDNPTTMIITLPKGTLSWTCEGNADASSGSASSTFHKSWYSCQIKDKVSILNFNGEDQSTQSGTIVLDAQEKLEISAITSKGSNPGSALAKITVAFTPDESSGGGSGGNDGGSNPPNVEENNDRLSLIIFLVALFVVIVILVFFLRR